MLIDASSIIFFTSSLNVIPTYFDISGMTIILNYIEITLNSTPIDEKSDTHVNPLPSLLRFAIMEPQSEPLTMR